MRNLLERVDRATLTAGRRPRSKSTAPIPSTLVAIDRRLRLGEASGAALALPLIALASKLHHSMRRFDEAGVDREEPDR